MLMTYVYREMVGFMLVLYYWPEMLLYYMYATYYQILALLQPTRLSYVRWVL